MEDDVIMPPVHPGEILLTEFFEPLELSQYQLARSIAVPPRRINGSCTASTGSAPGLTAAILPPNGPADGRIAMSDPLLLDEMFSDAIAQQLRAKGYDVVSVVAHPDLVGLPDDQILAYATTEGRALVTATSSVGVGRTLAIPSGVS
jgi:hypothetical protein